MRLLNLVGIPDSGKIRVLQNRGDLFRSDFHFPGNLPLLEYLGRTGALEVVTLLLGGLKSSEIRVGPTDLIFNSICDPDINAHALNVAAEVIEALEKPVINDPRWIVRSGRENVVRLLEGVEGVRLPSVIRTVARSANELIEAAERSVRYPFLVREAGKHGGKTFLKIDRPSEEWKLHCFPFDGRAYYLSSFVETRGEDGLYRKYRMVFIDGEPWPRHMIASREWMVHVGSRRELMANVASLRREEEEFLTEGSEKFAHLCAEIGHRVGLDFFGLDFGINREGQLVPFELNACMNVLGGGTHPAPFDYHNRRSDEIRQSIFAMMRRRAIGH
ncbi:ATP-grasp domain-containing protein [Nitratifractor salsuginis]|uniref:ATP-grasp domain-containing protein n=1 Tax=Nitratifractor salsuginis (strain DSM 16511 / JCM 12458 / E9I37-1) TaxID=749222 RepID=E6WZ74_NITSE|nr:hypothetical protein [Nitratifractor salsuginis]ADV46586.1 hypothetical protein Nitsa_1335 [Nitratifractor salsuginis DSM 16511]